MIKKLISILLITILAFSLTVSAEMDFDLSADADKIVSTPVKLNPGEKVKIIVLKEGSNLENLDEAADIFYLGVLSTGSETAEVSADINMEGAAEKKRYTVYSVVASDSSLTDVDSVKKIGFDTIANRLSTLNNLKTAIFNDEVKDDVVELLEENTEFLGINLTLYDLSSKDKVAQIMLSDKGRLSFNGENELRKMIDFIDESMLADVLNGDNADKISLGYLTRIIAEKEDYADVKELFAGIMDEYKVNVLNEIKNQNCSTYAQLRQLIKNSIVINAFNYTNASADKLYNILTYSKNITSPKLDLSKLNSITYADKMSATQGLSNNKYKTIEQLNTALIEEVEGEIIQNAPAGSGGGGGAGGGGGGSNAIETAPSTGIKPYTDMAGYTWAEDALYYLSHKNIISGYENGSFRPQNNITRAEFVKIVVSCFFGEVDNCNLPFEDVDDSMWYSKYIKTAFANGIISGVSEKEFSPNSFITRQDMAVVLYNAADAIEFYMETDEPAMTDNATISDYAKEAVFALKNTGIINGYEDGSFRPASYANRAETVQMIYNFLIKKGEYENEN